MNTTTTLPAKQAPKPTRFEIVNAGLAGKIQAIEELLPPAMKGHGDRLVKRAMLTFMRKKELQECSDQSFFMAVLDAAEMGLAIDGRLCHAVPYKGVAQCQPDYKGLIAVAKRIGIIKDAWGEVVCANDDFECGHNGPAHFLRHSFDVKQPRGDIVAAYAVAVFPDDGWRYDLMQIADVDKIMQRSKSFKAHAGPWITDTNEMRKKTVIRRLMKTLTDDPGMMKAFELLDADYEEDLTPGPSQPPATGRQSLRRNGRTTTPQAAPTPAPQSAGSAGELQASADAPEDNPADDEPTTKEAAERERETNEKHTERPPWTSDDADQLASDIEEGIRQAAEDKSPKAMAECATLLTRNESKLGNYRHKVLVQLYRQLEPECRKK